jgi:AcrR family transcriptional regulator
MPRYSEKQKAALDALMKNDVYRRAMEILESEGIDELTMERLATGIGVSRATLYNYFADKNAVIEFVEERTFGPVISAVERIAAEDLRPELKLTGIANWIFTAVYEDNAIVLALSPLRPGPRLHQTDSARKKRVLGVVEGIVRDGLEAGAFKKISPAVVAEAFVGSVIGMIESMAASGRFYRADAVVPTLMELVFGGLRSTDR